MCWFFELYFKNPQQDVEKSQTDINPQQLAVDCIDETIFKIPWGHHIQIIGKCRKDVNKNQCYVVVEIKTRNFEPGDMGQLGTYVAAVDGILKRENENPTVGLLICKTKDNVLAKYAVNTMNVPIGISEYDMNNFVKEHFKSSMPTIAEIENELSNK